MKTLCPPPQKIERLKSELHLLDAEGKQKNKHVFFMDTKREGMRDTGLETVLLAGPVLCPGACPTQRRCEGYRACSIPWGLPHPEKV